MIFVRRLSFDTFLITLFSKSLSILRIISLEVICIFLGKSYEISSKSYNPRSKQIPYKSKLLRNLLTSVKLILIELEVC